MADNITCHYFIFCIEKLIAVKFFSVFIVLCCGLLGCSSSGFRAPVSDLTLNSSARADSLVPSKSVSSAQKLKSYKVKAGDTLYAIAWKMDLDIATLAKYNNIKPPYTIYQGQVLSLTKSKQDKHLSAPTKTANAKNKPPLQKNEKKSSIPCRSQNCEKNMNKSVEQKKTKAYSASSTDSKAVQKVSKEQAKSTKISDWRWPAKGRLTKSFSASQAGMKGISISNQRGTPVYATASGQVVYAGSGLRGYGHLIIIKHNYDYLSAYAHNDTILVRENERIEGGQKIAIMGDSGTDSVHLHFEIRYHGKSVDPLRYLEKR